MERVYHLSLNVGYKHKPIIFLHVNNGAANIVIHTFSVTSGTVFANRKKPIKVYLYALMEWVNAVKGLSSLQLARNAKLNPRTAFVYHTNSARHYWKVVIWKPLSGVVDMDGTYVHPAPRKANKKSGPH